MGNYSFQGIDCSRLFDRSVKPISFQDNPNDHIPKFGSIIYTIWNNADEWIYVGIGGLGQSPSTPLHKRNPVSRIQQHKSGRRSGDQFCIYVHDCFVVPKLDNTKYKFVKGALDHQTKNYIQENLFYRFVVIQNEESIQLVRKIESQLKNGLEGFGKPLLNGI